MTRLLEIALQHEVEAATRTVTEAKNRVDADCSKRGMVRSGSHIKMTIRAFADEVHKLIPAAFARAMAVHEKAGVSETDAKKAAIDAVNGFIDTLRGKVDDVCQMSGGGDAAHRSAHEVFSEIDRDFAREAELYLAGVDRGNRPSPPTTHNTVTVTGDGNTLFAQQGTTNSTQNVQQTNAVLERLAAVIDDQPLTGSARRDVEAIVHELKAETAKPAPEKSTIATLLGNLKTSLGLAHSAVGIAQSAPEVVKAIADVGHAFGI